MKKEFISELFKKFEDACYDFDGVECWSARELQDILGYSQWRNFKNVIDKAQKSCEQAGEEAKNHFAEFSKMVEIGSVGSTTSRKLESTNQQQTTNNQQPTTNNQQQ
jgi:DNA-damage-inducible protein D